MTALRSLRAWFRAPRRPDRPGGARQLLWHKSAEGESSGRSDLHTTTLRNSVLVSPMPSFIRFSAVLPAAGQPRNLLLRKQRERYLANRRARTLVLGVGFDHLPLLVIERHP